MTTRRHRGSWTLITGLLLTGSACAGHGGSRNSEAAQPAAHAVHLRVSNQYGFPMTIYAVGSGISFRIGRVLPGLVSDFVLPQAIVGNGPVEFLADGDGNAPSRSGQFRLAPGQVVEFNISRPTYPGAPTVRP